MRTYFSLQKTYKNRDLYASDEDRTMNDYERELNKEQYNRYEDYHENESPIRNIPKQRTRKVDGEQQWKPKNYDDD